MPCAVRSGWMVRPTNPVDSVRGRRRDVASASAWGGHAHDCEREMTEVKTIVYREHGRRDIHDRLAKVVANAAGLPDAGAFYPAVRRPRTQSASAGLLWSAEGAQCLKVTSIMRTHRLANVLLPMLLRIDQRRSRQNRHVHPIDVSGVAIQRARKVWPVFETWGDDARATPKTPCESQRRSPSQPLVRGSCDPSSRRS